MTYRANASFVHPASELKVGTRAYVSSDSVPQQVRGKSGDGRVSLRRTLHIAHITATFPPYYAGTGNVCFHNARVLAERGHRVEVFTAEHPGVVVDPVDVTVHRIRPFLRLGNAPFIPQLGLLPKFDLIHLHLPFIFGAEFVRLRALRAETPYVVTIHNRLEAGGVKGSLFRIYERVVSPRVLGHAAAICAVTLPHALSLNAVRAFQSRGTPLVAIPNGVDTSQFCPGLNGAEVRSNNHIPADAIVIAAVASLDEAHRFKRIDIAITALAQTKSSKDIRLLVIGDGALRPHLEEHAARMRVADRVVFAGAIPHSALPPYIAASNALVLPSDSVESFGLVLLEAMACGKPVITSALPGPSSLVSPGVDGFVFPVNDCEALGHYIDDLAESAELCEQLGKAGRAKVECHYTWAHAAAKLEETYRTVLDAAGTGKQASFGPHARQPEGTYR